MRKPMMVANWKMNKERDESLQFIFSVNQVLPDRKLVETVVCAQDLLLRCLVKRQGENLRIGAQNMHYETSGAFTGETSPTLLASTGVEYVILGHSERRQMFYETYEIVNQKIKSALHCDLTPIVCIGETLEQRENGSYIELLKQQITVAYTNISPIDVCKTVIAYEPIWAIGTGVTATPEIANAACALVREIIKGLYGASISEEIRILYGGSVNVGNVNELMNQDDIDGALVGGASLDADSFTKLTKACL